MIADEEILPDEQELRLMAAAYFRAALEGGDPHFRSLIDALNRFDSLGSPPPAIRD